MRARQRLCVARATHVCKRRHAGSAVLLRQTLHLVSDRRLRPHAEGRTCRAFELGGEHARIGRWLLAQVLATDVRNCLVPPRWLVGEQGDIGRRSTRHDQRWHVLVCDRVSERAEINCGRVTGKRDLHRAMHRHVGGAEHVAERRCITSHRLRNRLEHLHGTSAAGVIAEQLRQAQQQIDGERCTGGHRVVRDVSRSREQGFVIGSGMDVKLSEHFSLGMEGLYYAFEDDKVLFFENGDQIATIHNDNDFYVVRARLTYHLQ